MSEKVKLMNEFDSYGAVTHEVSNQPQDLLDYNLFTTDIALQEAVTREGAAWATDELDRFGAESGRADYLALGQLANKYIPEFDTHDHHGHRVDVVRFHPAYHQLMQKAISEGLHASPWLHPQAGAHVARAARFYMQSQVEAGHGCPVTMTFAAIPCLQAQPDLAAQWLPKIMSLEYDPRNIPAAQKKGLTIGMAMTEKQGGSDVRANTTRAILVAASSYADGGQTYELTGHKYFVSAPMSDAFLVLAQAPGGLSCFLLPRWRPDGSKNPLQIQRLKKKMGNVSNASSETELRGALAWMVGKEGRGVATIIEMVAMTRFDCMIGSSAGMRAALNQALHHCRQRKTFGTLLTEQPLMQNVLADLALESEAALALTMRMARAIDNRYQRTQPSEDLLLRLGTAIGKYWICKRTPQHAYEAMECIGGSGVMEETVMPRLYREAPVNAIWEGSGNVQCLDVLRAISKTPEVLPVFFAELDKAKMQHIVFDRYVEQLKTALRDTTDLEYRARDLVDRMALALQAAQLLMSAPVFVSDAFCRSRLDSQGHHQYGALPRHIGVKSIIERAMPG
ncbi:isovaleryl-CoA dehydrogenase [Undibacterium sp. Xuan67W]|uniref:isovaleryl-CoA dehydrogenase n=1 Tax=Undibacterium sp. Xuan67W TaxID=3413057 RepID=UPI003BF2572B